MDFVVAYEKGVPQLGRFRGQVEGTYLFKYQETNAEGKTREGRGVYDLGLFPDVKAKVVLQWGKDNLGVGTNLRYISSLTECEDNDCRTHMNDGHERTIDAYVTGDVFASYTLASSAGKTILGGGVNNVLDATPAAIYNVGPDSDPSGYDFVGRYFYVRLTQAF